MSQPQLTKFFANAKRGTKINAKSAKLLLDPVETAPKRSSRRNASESESVKKVEVTELSAPEVLEPTKANVPAVKKRVEKDDEANEITEKENQGEAGSCPSPVKKTRRSSRSRENSCSGDKVEEEVKEAKKPAVKKRTTARAKLAEVKYLCTFSLVCTVTCTVTLILTSNIICSLHPTFIFPCAQPRTLICMLTCTLTCSSDP